MTKKWIKVSGVILGILLLIAISGVLTVCYYQARLLVYNVPEARRAIEKSPADSGLHYETLTLTTEDGYQLAAWYIPSQNRAVIIVQHGYKNNRASVLHVTEMLARHGYGVMMVDLRACGLSEGEQISFGLYETRDLNAAYQYLLTRSEIDAERIGAYGVSLGGVVVLLYAAENANIKAVVAESAFVSLQEQVAKGIETFTPLPAFPFAPIIQWFAERIVGFNADEVAPIEHISSISPNPVFLMQGGADEIICPDSGHRLYEAAGEPRELWFEPELGHGAFGHEKAEEFEIRVVEFFNRYLLGKE